MNDPFGCFTIPLLVFVLSICLIYSFMKEICTHAFEYIDIFIVIVTCFAYKRVYGISTKSTSNYILIR